MISLLPQLFKGRKTTHAVRTTWVMALEWRPHGRCVVMAYGHMVMPRTSQLLTLRRRARPQNAPSRYLAQRPLGRLGASRETSL